LAGLFIALYLAYRNSKPLRALVRQISDKLSYEQGHRDAFGFIENTVSKLISNNEQLTTEIEAQRPLLKSTFFERLLKGGYVTTSEINVWQRHVQISLNGNYYVVAMLQLQD